MKYVLFCLLALKPSTHQAQISAYGLEYSRNLATQLNFDPQRPNDGTFQWDYLKTNSIGLFLQYNLTKTLFVDTKLKYIVKGTTESVQSLRVPGQFNTIYESRMENRFNYLAMDVNAKYSLIRNRHFRLHPYLGMRHNFLLSYHLESDVFPINLVYPIKYYTNFRSYNLGIVLGIEFCPSDWVTLSGETSWDTHSIISSERLKVKNWLWSANLGINMSQMFSRKRSIKCKNHSN
jgi:RNA 3'-terminal phosphate cyclase